MPFFGDMPGKTYIILFLLVFLAAGPVSAEQEKVEGTIFTLWPFVDYRESPGEEYSNLSILGPLFKLQRRGGERDLAIRPFFFDKYDKQNDSSETAYLYPVAASESSADVYRLQVMEFYQKNIYRKDEGENSEEGKMLFPFYIKGSSPKYGPYTSVFPFYGDLYERFWRDEYHYVMFPFYGRTVKNGRSVTNYLYPFFSVTNGERESGFQFWPIYGQSAKEGVYSKQFFLWPIFFNEKEGLDTDNPTSRLYLLPFYAAIDTSRSKARYYGWPFFGYKWDDEGEQKETDYFWPFWRTIRGKERRVDSWFPFYSLDERRETKKRWIMWPFFKHEEINSDIYQWQKDRFLYFLYVNDRQSWPKAQGKKVRTAMWPFFVYNSNPTGIKSVTVPAPVEPIVDREGIEKSWAPLWRIYQQRWNERGDSAVSFLWNLYWHEKRGADLAFELFPFIAYRSEGNLFDLRLMKGMIRFRNDNGERALSFLWLPFGVQWGKAGAGSILTATGSKP